MSPAARTVPTGHGLFDLPAELAIDTDVARRVIGEFIRGQLRQAGFERALVGLSGGIDSALVAFLVAEAIGPDRLLCLMLPYRTSAATSRGDAEAVLRAARLRRRGSSISARWWMPISVVRTKLRSGATGPGGPPASAVRRGNFMARTRMAVLYDRSVTWAGLVVGTGNKTESLIGYTTIFGDAASAFNPIGDLYKSQVRQLAAAIGVPEAIIRKAPSADLWPGQTDETEAGFTYPELDRLLFWLVDRRRSPEELEAKGFARERIEWAMRAIAGVRVQAPGCADRQAGAAHGRGRLPLPAPPARLGPDLRIRRTVPAAAGRLFIVSTPIGNLADVTVRALEVLRTVPLIAAEDTRHSRRLLAPNAITTHLVSFHARNAATRLPELLAHLRTGADLALVTDAGTPGVSDPGDDLVGAWAAEGGLVVPDPGGISGPCRSRRQRARRAALVVRGLPAAIRAGAPGANRPDRGR